MWCTEVHQKLVSLFYNEDFISEEVCFEWAACYQLPQGQRLPETLSVLRFMEWIKAASNEDAAQAVS